MGSIQKGDNFLLWCDGLKSTMHKCKGKSPSAIDSSESGDDP